MKQQMNLTKQFATMVMVAWILSSSAQAANIIKNTTDVFTPSFRGESNTTYFGWDDFEDSEVPGVPLGSRIDDTTPDINTIGAPAGTRFKQDDALLYGHRSSSGNYYSGFGATDVAGDTFTAPTDGTEGVAGFTTVILQILAQVDNLPPLEFDDVAGVSPEVVSGLNANNAGQYFVKYELPGNAASYDVRLFTSAATSVAVDKFEIDTLYSPKGYAPDFAIVPEPATLAVAILGGAALLARRGCKTVTC